MEKIRFGTYIPVEMKEKLDLLSERSKIKIAPLVEEAIGDLFEKQYYKEMLEDKDEMISNVSMKRGWLCLSSKAKKVYLKTLKLSNGKQVTVTIDTFSENPMKIQDYILEDKIDLNSWENIFSETISKFKYNAEGLNELKKLLSNEEFVSIKEILELEQTEKFQKDLNILMEVFKDNE